MRYLFQTIEFQDVDIHVRSLRDNQEFSDDDGVSEALGISSSNWPLFGILWGSGLALARLMMDYHIEGRRILEVGCGLGLSSLVLDSRHADISATDVHPEAETFLKYNVELNDIPSIPFVRARWNEGDLGIGDFDLIIGSDLMYERDQAETLATFIDQHARSTCEVIIVDPGRGQLSRFGKMMTALGYSQNQIIAKNENREDGPARQQICRYVRQ